MQGNPDRRKVCHEIRRRRVVCGCLDGNLGQQSGAQLGRTGRPRLGDSGSLRVEADYFTPAGDGWEQMVITRTFAEPLVGSDYVSVSVDVKVDPSSVLNSDGNYGYFELKRPSDATSMGG
ncbi:MAG: hypothetical protein M5U12_21360 [Verrucomicrobia bacterium]|nr:hypothetical protein [Verrucomicrobiota bacterium]